MFSPYKALLQRMGQPYSIERGGIAIQECRGLQNRETTTKRRYVGFPVETDIKPNDWIINSTGERLIIEDTHVTYFQSEPSELQAFYLTEVEHNNQKSQYSTFHIENAYGSVIGNQSHFSLNYSASIQQMNDQIEKSDSPDKDDLKKITALLEMVVNNQVPVSKGLFSKFSAVMERNSWISSAIASTLMGWMTTQLH